ncbi:E3 ubiquitin-protein ligase dtx3l [Mayamaea pseudoterrestris]|nr:E3 ubiquitin-protein ligase dtx3l [Mayamaea pseudoterrestris]
MFVYQVTPVSRFKKLLRRAVFKRKEKAQAPAAQPHAFSDPTLQATLQQPIDAAAANAAAAANDDTAATGDDVDVLVDLAQADEVRLIINEQLESQMMDTKQGKAVKFVQAVLDLHESLKATDPIAASEIHAVAKDEMVWFVERMLLKRDEFQAAGMSTALDCGYHWTRAENLEKIQTDGLLSKKERTERKIESHYNGSQYGDGIYTCDDGLSYRNTYGPVCLLVARLKGATDTVVSNATYAAGRLVVLRTCEQCVPILQFTLEPNALIHKYHDDIQALIDQFFNVDCVAAPVAVSRNKTLYYTAPDVFDAGALAKITSISAKKICATDDCCVICHELLESQQVGQLQGCGHCQFHYECIVEAVGHSSRCPLCSKNLVEPQGTMPTGEMRITIQSTLTCGGYALGTIQIDYILESGVQKVYHASPGVAFEGTRRTAFLPDNIEGQLLLKRLEYAFLHGLTFTVGTSLTTGKTNSIVWASIHHKTAPLGGSFGFPDPNYFWNCNEELDHLGVPSALYL